MDIYVRVDQAAGELERLGQGNSACQLATLLCESCDVHGPATDEEAVELLAATPLRDAIALIPTALHRLVQHRTGTAHVDWILAARVALCAEFFRLQHVMCDGSEPQDLAPFARAAAAQWKTYLHNSR